jgi:hypothetical protein
MLKNEESNIKHKISLIKNKENNNNQIKKEKVNRKLELEKIKKEHEKILNNKINIVKNQKNDEITGIKTSRHNSMVNKKVNYIYSLNEKNLLKNIKEQHDNIIKNKNKYLHEKIKQNINEYESKKLKIKNEINNNKLKDYESQLKILNSHQDNLKKEFIKLELLEKEALNNLNQKKTESKMMENLYNLKFSFPTSLKKSIKINENENDIILKTDKNYNNNNLLLNSILKDKNYMTLNNSKNTLNSIQNQSFSFSSKNQNKTKKLIGLNNKGYKKNKNQNNSVL